MLKGHIALDSAVFPERTPGFVLDVLARRALWAAGLDYRHGTGHGVGTSFIHFYLGYYLLPYLKYLSFLDHEYRHLRTDVYITGTDKVRILFIFILACLGHG